MCREADFSPIRGRTNKDGQRVNGLPQETDSPIPGDVQGEGKRNYLLETSIEI